MNKLATFALEMTEVNGVDDSGDMPKPSQPSH